MKKIISILLVIMTVLSFSVSSSAEENPSIVRNIKGIEGSLKEKNIGSGNYISVLLDGGKTAAEHITLNGKIKKVKVFCPSWSNAKGSLRFSLFDWKKDYKTTVAQKPVNTKDFVDYADNAYLTIEADALKTSDFLILIENITKDPEEKVGVWSVPNSLVQGSEMYINGEKTENCISVTVSFSEATSESGAGLKKFDAYSKMNFAEADSFMLCNAVGITDNQQKISALNISDGSNVMFGTVDFGSESPKGAEIYLQNVGCGGNSGQMQVILDDILSGDIIAQLGVDYNSQTTHFETVSGKITENISGEHKVFVTFTGTGYTPVNIKFTKDIPSEDNYAKRLREFNETKSFEIDDMYSDTWLGCDMLGRKFIGNDEAGEYNPDKKVGVFYLTWHAVPDRVNLSTASNNQKVLDTYNGNTEDIINNMDYPKWGSTGYWNESVYGYYHGLDIWVMRKQLELLSAAGMDLLFCDATNGAQVYQGGYMALCGEMHKMHLEGTKTPGVAFVLPFSDGENTVTDLENLYENMYSLGLYNDCWFYWKGKPLIMSYYDQLTADTGYSDVDAQHSEIRDFFTFRPGQPGYFAGSRRDDDWPWLEVYPQHPYGKSEKYGCECVSVGIAQNANASGLCAMNAKGVYGRSYTYKDKFSKYSETSKYYGYNIEEQWQRAYELDPEIVFLDGWNEWIAGHYESWGADNATGAYPDQFSDEYSRDFEPTKGDFKDAYYCQLVNNIRRFKGVRKFPEVSPEKSIDIGGDFSQWAEVTPEYKGYKGGTEERNAKGAVASPADYKDTSGRNDIILSKVARDAENVYFYVKTAEALSPYTDPSWMRLFINTDRTYTTGWEGYDYIINRVSPTESKATLEKATENKWKWEKVGEVDYKVVGNEMMICVPREMLGAETLDFEFKWNDNMQKDGDIMDFYVSGDTAPISRFAYYYCENRSKGKKIADEKVVVAKKPSDYLRYSTVMRVGTPLTVADDRMGYVDPNNTDVFPKIVNDKTLVPIRYFCESLGATVEWNASTNTATIYLGGKRIRVTIGSDIMLVEKEQVTLQTPAMEENGRILVPLRDIAEAAGETVLWAEPDIIILGGKKADLENNLTAICEYISDMYK